MSELKDLEYWRSRARALLIPANAYIDGQWTGAADGATLDCINPATGEQLARVAACGAADVDRAVAAARRAFEAGVWSAMPRRERKAVLLRLAALIEMHREELALLETLDMG
ncbi:MAG TPA: aldehyde dehydrogenase PuuC, partial [Cupriavidus sp.]|nr:aldehyde dehydrogenase PuuC [Cupriavidus sp.]